MTALTDREKALEEKYFLDFEMAFKVRSRREQAFGAVGRGPDRSRRH